MPKSLALRLAPDVYWRREADCILVSTPSGVLRLDDDWRAAWDDLALCSADPSVEFRSLGSDAQALLADLVSGGLVIVEDVGGPAKSVHAREDWRWDHRLLGHLPGSWTALQPDLSPPP